MGEIRAGGSEGGVFADVRGAERTMRITHHPEQDIVVLSLWLGPLCRSSFRLPADQVPALVTALSAEHPDSAHATTGEHPTGEHATTGEHAATGEHATTGGYPTGERPDTGHPDDSDPDLDPGRSPAAPSGDALATVRTGAVDQAAALAVSRGDVPA
ncbi:hypothetical protein [Plantactinospora sp. KBS50]|uniref:hypothetical protein n=1 Tax=Plantactinospora sp. KBS50 TaxID=2024580 RepID=UPI000BAAAB96|nr:hypothetical protein [Plantactinospora sp. KBS50]ASW55047.1 hypothetical protein CIK06_13945 [Plantactinospora sp. KBS50]